MCESPIALKETDCEELYSIAEEHGLVLMDALEQIYNIIDSRYRSRKPLIVTTNLTLTELKNPQDTAHARIYDRLLELCTPIACTGPSMRKDIGQAKLNLLKTLLA